MMREDVLIVLNERETLKEKMAAELVQQLALRSISCARIKPSSKLASIISERSPRIVILDYLLGDFGTAHDIISALRGNGDTLPILPILWTDEPSVSVAVTAMKIGAFDFIELHKPKSLEKVIASIESGLDSYGRKNLKKYEAQPVWQSEKIIAQSLPYQECVNVATSVARRECPIVVLLGACGSGRNTLAHLIHRSRSTPGAYREVAFDLWPEPIQFISGDPMNPRLLPLLAFGTTLFLDHVEFDYGELLEAIRLSKDHLWSRQLPSPAPMLIVGTSSKECAQSWVRVLDAEIIELPSLRERPDDFFPLIKHFIAEIDKNFQPTKLQISSELLSELLALDWPGNVRQLKQATVEAVSSPQQVSEDSERTLSRSEQGLFDSILLAKNRWERYHTVDRYLPTPFEARRALDLSSGNERIAAAHLGTGIAQIRAALSKDTYHEAASK